MPIGKSLMEKGFIHIIKTRCTKTDSYCNTTGHYPHPLPIKIGTRAREIFDAYFFHEVYDGWLNISKFFNPEYPLIRN